jgi:hypothetical protein
MIMFHRTRALAALTLVVCSSSCIARSLVAPEPKVEVDGNGVWVQQPELKLDILFMVDNSLSMDDKQKNLATNFPRFMKVLEDAVPAGGALDAHIAVVSSDLGVAAGGEDATCFSNGGDNGRFQATPRGACAGPRDHFIITNGAQKNFDGAIGDVFSCIARLGTRGCGFEHQLGSVRRALGGDPAASMPPENAGFLRDDARLGIILITDEDDCTAPAGSDLFTNDPAKLAAYGPRQSWRCNEFGHLCGGAPPPRAPAEGLTCEPNETASSRLVHVSDFVAFVNGLKRDPDLVRVAAITGPTTPYGSFTMQTKEGPVTTVSPSCRGAAGTDTGDGAPSVRIKAFVDAFGTRGRVESICDADFGPAMEHIAHTLIPDLVPCIGGKLYDRDLATPGVQPDCNVSEEAEREVGQAPLTTVIPACDAAGGATPCWRIAAEPRCTAAPGGSAIVVDRGAGVPAPDTRAKWSCRVCPAGDTSPACAH